MSSGRIMPGSGVPLDLQPVTGLVAANTDPGLAANKEQEITIGGAPAEATSQTYAGLIGGAPGTGDLIVNVLDGVDYVYVGRAAETIVTFGDESTKACTLGTYATWVFSVAGGPAAGGEHQVLVCGANTYDYAAVAGNGAGQVTNGIVALAVADANFWVYRNSGDLYVKSRTRGVPAVIPTFTPDGVVFTSISSTPAAGLAGQLDWTVTDDGAGTVTAELAVPGDPGLHTYAGSATQVTGTTTFAPAETIHGYYADIAAVTDGVMTYAYMVQSGDAVDDVADGLNVALNADGYVSTNLAAVDTVTRVDYTDFTFVDASISTNPASTMTVVVNTTVVFHAQMAASAGVGISSSKLATGSLECLLQAGTSYDVAVWCYDSALGIWLFDATLGVKTIIANQTHQVTLTGDLMYVQVDNFVGGAIATVKLTTKG